MMNKKRVFTYPLGLSMGWAGLGVVQHNWTGPDVVQIFAGPALSMSKPGPSWARLGPGPEEKVFLSNIILDFYVAFKWMYEMSVRKESKNHMLQQVILCLSLPILCLFSLFVLFEI